MAVTTTSVIRIGTAPLTQCKHSVVSRLYPSTQMEHIGPLVPSKHPSLIISVEVLFLTPIQSLE